MHPSRARTHPNQEVEGAAAVSQKRAGKDTLDEIAERRGEVPVKRGGCNMRRNLKVTAPAGLMIIGIAMGAVPSQPQSGPKPGASPSSYLPVIREDFARCRRAWAGPKRRS